MCTAQEMTGQDKKCALHASATLTKVPFFQFVFFSLLTYSLRLNVIFECIGGYGMMVVVAMY